MDQRYFQFNLDTYDKKQPNRNRVSFRKSRESVPVWSLDELHYLVENIRKTGYVEVARHLGRSPGGVRAKASQLGVSRLGLFPSVPRLSDSQVGHLAGIIDGEGSVGLSKSITGWVVQVRFVNTNEKVIERVQEWLGFGKVTIHRPSAPRKPIYALWFNLRESFVLLRIIEKSLIIKRHQAGLVSEAIELILNYRDKPVEVVARLEGIQSELKELNKRGTSP
jgi:hypothetical protein